MASAQLLAHSFASDTIFAEPPTLGDGQLAPSHSPNLNNAIETALRAKRIALGLEHRDLDATICVLDEAGTGDELLISRLKKRRLHLKDEIARIDGCLPA